MIMVNSMIPKRHVPSLAAACITSATRHGTQGFAAFLSLWGALIAALPSLLDDLEKDTGRPLLRVEGLDPSRKRYVMVNPVHDPPAYWPRKRR
jgi:hypothetical protein